jgi:hypothetical protein
MLQVLAAVSFCIANIAKDKENLAVITDHGVIHKYVPQTNLAIIHSPKIIFLSYLSFPRYNVLTRSNVFPTECSFWE